jgi:hypothetical protein
MDKPGDLLITKDFEDSAAIRVKEFSHFLQGPLDLQIDLDGGQLYESGRQVGNQGLKPESILIRCSSYALRFHDSLKGVIRIANRDLPANISRSSPANAGIDSRISANLRDPRESKISHKQTSKGTIKTANKESVYFPASGG